MRRTRRPTDRRPKPRPASKAFKWERARKTACTETLPFWTFSRTGRRDQIGEGIARSRVDAARLRFSLGRRALWTLTSTPWWGCAWRRLSAVVGRLNPVPHLADSQSRLFRCSRAPAPSRTSTRRPCRPRSCRGRWRSTGSNCCRSSRAPFRCTSPSRPRHRRPPSPSPHRTRRTLRRAAGTSKLRSDTGRRRTCCRSSHRT
jgi:hypothetical protein